MIVGFAVSGEARSIAAYRRTYNGATGQNLFASSFRILFKYQTLGFTNSTIPRSVKDEVIKEKNNE